MATHHYWMVGLDWKGHRHGILAVTHDCDLPADFPMMIVGQSPEPRFVSARIFGPFDDSITAQALRNLWDGGLGPVDELARDLAFARGVRHP